MGLFYFPAKVGVFRIMDQQYMKRSLELSLCAWGKVSPNPYVGAVIVKDNQIIAEGWHKACGGPHAEIEALNIAQEKAEGATIYVTLEPCCHYGKTGPCTEAIIQAGIKRVVYAIDDPNPKVCGRGKEILEQAGIEVCTGICEEEARRINEVFFFNQIHQNPFVSLKAALSLDGKMATSNNESKWITGEKARIKTHDLRAGYDAILIGAGTLRDDNPQLTVREGNYVGKNPIRIILLGKTTLINYDAEIFNTSEAETWLIYPENLQLSYKSELEQKNVRLIPFNNYAGEINISDLLEFLHEENIKSLFVEGGPKVHSSFLQSGNVQRLYLFFAPKLIGGTNAPGLWGGDGITLLKESPILDELQMEYLNPDIFITGRLKEVT